MDNSMLAQLANIVEDIAERDFSIQPAVKFREALVHVARYDYDIPLKVLRPIILKMKVDISEFDIDNPIWVRIVEAYALVLKKLYDIYDDEMVHLGDDFSIEYKV